jgi:MerR family transcriptional regulator, heat shock protein HspR
MLNEERPVYTIGTAAELLGVHTRTLRLYEDGGLVHPARKNNRRFYSDNDLKWIGCIRAMIHEQGLNQEGLRRLLGLVPCWEIKTCPADLRLSCTAWVDRSVRCWDLARRTCSFSNRCSDCTAYSPRKDLA